MAVKKQLKPYREYFAFDLKDDGDGPYIVDHNVTCDLNEAKHYQYYICIELPARAPASGKLLVTAKV